MNHEKYINRCIEIALRAGGDVGTNPNVGAVIVHKGRVIGEGYHRHFGGPHAEVNAINSVTNEDRHLIKDSTMYVSLEPCCIFSKTPPCTDLIMKHGIKMVVIGCEDPNPKMAGSSIELLAANGVQVVKNICREASEALIKPFKVNILKNRPFITIKFAQSSDFYISRKGEQTWLSNEYSKVFSHKLRSLNHGILVGRNTVMIDNPSLTTRLYPGEHPLRIFIDPKNNVSANARLLTDEHKTLIINSSLRNETLKTAKEQWTAPISLSSLLSRLYREKHIGRLLVEGGTATINHFLKEGMWDQAYVITCNKKLGEGVLAPTINGKLRDKFHLSGDSVQLIIK